jgi:hypothetical protein
MLFSAAVQPDLHLLQQQELAAEALAAAAGWQAQLSTEQPGVLLQQLAAQHTAVLGTTQCLGSAYAERLLSSSSSSNESSGRSSSSLQVPRPLWCAAEVSQQAVVGLQTWAATKWWSYSSNSSSSSTAAVLSLSDLIRQRSMQLSQQLVEAAAASKQWQQQQQLEERIAQMSAVMA